MLPECCLWAKLYKDNGCAVGLFVQDIPVSLLRQRLRAGLQCNAYHIFLAEESSESSLGFDVPCNDKVHYHAEEWNEAVSTL